MKAAPKPSGMMSFGIVCGAVFLGVVFGAWTGSQEPVDQGMFSVDSPFLHEVVGGIGGALAGGVFGVMIVVLGRLINRPPD